MARGYFRMKTALEKGFSNAKINTTIPTRNVKECIKIALQDFAEKVEEHINWKDRKDWEQLKKQEGI